MVNIDKNIPIPEKSTSGRNNEIHSVLEVMEINDSFELEADAVKSNGTKFSRFISTFRATGTLSYGYKFSQRLSKDRTKIRVWRIK